MTDKPAEAGESRTQQARTKFDVSSTARVDPPSASELETPVDHWWETPKWWGEMVVDEWRSRTWYGKLRYPGWLLGSIIIWAGIILFVILWLFLSGLPMVLKEIGNRASKHTPKVYKTDD